VYVFIFYSSFTYDSSDFDFVKGQSSLFKGEMAMMIMLLLIIIIVERVASRTDTKKVEEKSFSLQDREG